MDFTDITIQARAGADLSTYTGYAVYADGADSENVKVAATAGRRILGILRKPSVDDASCQVAVTGFVDAVLGGAVEPFDVLAVSAAGKLVKATPGAVPVAIYCPTGLGSSSTPALPDGANTNIRRVLLLPSSLAATALPIYVTETEDVGAISDGASATFAAAATGAVDGDAVIPIRPAALDAGLVLEAYVSAADTVTFVVTNASGGAINPAELTYRATVIPATANP